MKKISLLERYKQAEEKYAKEFSRLQRQVSDLYELATYHADKRGIPL